MRCICWREMWRCELIAVPEVYCALGVCTLNVREVTPRCKFVGLRVLSTSAGASADAVLPSRAACPLSHQPHAGGWQDGSQPWPGLGLPATAHTTCQCTREAATHSELRLPMPRRDSAAHVRPRLLRRRRLTTQRRSAHALLWRRPALHDLLPWSVEATRRHGRCGSSLSLSLSLSLILSLTRGARRSAIARSAA